MQKLNDRSQSLAPTEANGTVNTVIETSRRVDLLPVSCLASRARR
jgi:hypothetical protein